MTSPPEGGFRGLLGEPGRKTEVIYTVSELSGAIRQGLDRVFPGILSLEGELSNVKRSEPAGHYYFTLKDAASSLRGVMFRGAAAGLSFLPRDGLHVLVRGRLSYYEPRGEIQMIVESMGPAGLGLFHLEFQRVRGILEKEGLLSPDRKRPIPSMPGGVALITSPRGAAVWDFLRICDQQNRLTPVLVVPARMQGSEAAGDIIRALSLISEIPWIEVAVITRGGGSAEDLWAFNREDLARAILSSPVPVVTAIGHEVDVTVADLVADLRVATPTEAAKRVFFDGSAVLEKVARMRTRMVELEEVRLSRERGRLQEFRLSSGNFYRRLSHIHLSVVRAQDRLSGSCRERMARERALLGFRAGQLVHPAMRLALLLRSVDARASRLAVLVRRRIEGPGQTLSDCVTRLSRNRLHGLERSRLALERARVSLPARIERFLGEAERKLVRLNTSLRERSPEGPLRRGFFLMIRQSDGRTVSLENPPVRGEFVLARTAGLSLLLEVLETRPENRRKE